MENLELETLYYTVKKELQSIDDSIEETIGYKTVLLYCIEDNKLKILTSIELSNEDNSLEEIECYLESNGYGDQAYNFIEL